MIDLVIRAAGFDSVEDPDLVIVVLREHEDGTGLGVDFQRALVFDEQDRALGMDTYCLSTSGGASIYGGVRSCVLEDRTLSVTLSADAQAQLGIEDGLQLDLVLDDESMERVRTGLARVFQGAEDLGQLRLG